jgi:hypothetical protein
MNELGVQMIPAYSPQARGRSERSFGTWQGRLPQEFRLAQVTTVEGANRYLRDHYIARRFNEQFTVASDFGKATLPLVVDPWNGRELALSSIVLSREIHPAADPGLGC